MQMVNAAVVHELFYILEQFFAYYYTFLPCMYLCRKAVLQIEAELGNSSDSSESECDDNAGIERYVQKMNELRDNLFRKAKSNIDGAQLRQKRDYDRKHAISKRKVMMTCINIFILV